MKLNLASRKFILAVVLVLSATILVVADKISADQWLYYTVAIATGYGIFNVASKFSNGKK